MTERSPLSDLSRSALSALERDLDVRINRATGDLRRLAERGEPGPAHYAELMRLSGQLKAYGDQRYFVHQLLKEEERG